MRITGFSEDEEGNGRYLVEWKDAGGRKVAVLYAEIDGTSEKLSDGVSASLFEDGGLEACSFPASEVFFPDEVKALAERYENAAEEENE